MLDIKSFILGKKAGGGSGGAASQAEVDEVAELVGGIEESNEEIEVDD